MSLRCMLTPSRSEPVLDTADPGGTFHKEVRVNDILVTSWDQYVSSDHFRPFKHLAAVDIGVEAGDKITYYFYGGTATYSVGGIE